MGQKERNKATEVVDGVVETVDVSKHPTASIEPSDLSLADIERRKSHPVRWILFMALVLLAMIAPYCGDATSRCGTPHGWWRT